MLLLNVPFTSALSATTDPFFMIGDDAANKVGVGVPQGGHEFGQLFLIQLTHGAEHALLSLISSTKCCLVHACNLVQTHNSVN